MQEYTTLLSETQEQPAAQGLEELKNTLALNKESRILPINTEGNADLIYFRKIIPEGANPLPTRILVGLLTA